MSRDFKYSKHVAGDSVASVSSFAPLRQDKKVVKKLKFDKSFKPGYHDTSIFIWGAAHPSKIFPQHSNQATPFKHEQLTSKRFIQVCAAKDGHHAFGVTDNDWAFVWGESEYPNTLGLGPNMRSTMPFLIKPLTKKKIIQIVCSAHHGLALTSENKVYTWGAKLLTGLPDDVAEPHPLRAINNLGITALSCSSSHSAAYIKHTGNVFTWGISGQWLGYKQFENKNFGRMEFTEPVGRKYKTIHQVACGHEYTMVIFSDGSVSTCGSNEHGKMGIGKDTLKTFKPMRIKNIPPIVDISVGPLHCAFITEKGQIYTCGIGTDFRLGHKNEETLYEPQLVKALAHGDVQIVRVECVDDRTFAITNLGCVLMWGVEPVTEMIHTSPFVFQYLRTHRIYQICGGKDFTMAFGVQVRDAILRPKVDGYDDPRMKRTNKVLTSEITNVLGHTKQVGDGGFNVEQVLGGYAQVGKSYEISHPNPNPPPPPPPAPTQSMQKMAKGFEESIEADGTIPDSSILMSEQPPASHLRTVPLSNKRSAPPITRHVPRGGPPTKPLPTMQQSPTHHSNPVRPQQQKPSVLEEKQISPRQSGASSYTGKPASKKGRGSSRKRKHVQKA